MPPGTTCSPTSKDTTIVSGFIPLSGISPPNRQSAKPLNPMSTKSGEGHFGLLTPSTVALDRHLDRLEQLLLVQGLGQELNRPGFHCPHGHGNVTVTADKYDWKMDIRFDQRTLEFQSARSRQSNVKHDATGCIGALALNEFLR